jgi:hypothetical protein
VNNKGINEFKNSIIVYNKENPSIKILGNTYTHPYTGKLVYKEHIIISSNNSKTSLTSSEKVMYREKINEEYVKRSVLSNLLGKKQNGKNQYGLMYKLNENHQMNFHETTKLNIHILKNFGIIDKKSLIAYKYRMWVSIKAQDQWNVLSRGQSSYQTRYQINREDSFVNLNTKLSKMSDYEVYQHMKNNIPLSQMFWIEQRYYSHFRNFNYYTKEEWEQLRKKEIEDYKESKIGNKDDLL